MNRQTNERTSVSTLLGMPVMDSEGRRMGRVAEFAVAPTVDSSKVEALVVRATTGRSAHQLLIPFHLLKRGTHGRLTLKPDAEPGAMPGGDAYLLLERDLLDQQIIDVHGHKVVRVNDVDLVWETSAEGDLTLRIAEVEVGLRGAVRRMLKGMPAHMIESVACRLRPSVIPWDFVDLIDRDPSRRVRLKIEQDRLAKMHPSDLADILEELAPTERQALFTSLDDEVAAETLEEVELKTQKRLIESMGSEQVAGIIEEMDPAAAADLLSVLTDERSDAILEEMGEKERHEVEELLDYEPDSAAGLMTTEFVQLPEDATVEAARKAVAEYDGDVEQVTDVFVCDAGDHLLAAVPVGRLFVSDAAAEVRTLAEGHMVSSALTANGRKVAELFDKYNLRCLPVLDAEKRLVGVVRAEQVIGWLRGRH